MFVRYTVSLILKNLEERSYRQYVTESLRLAPQMMYLSESWYSHWDKIKRSEPERTADEIIDDVISKIGV